MNARWERVAEVFAEATEVPAAEREAWVRTRCGGDLELTTEVLSLLAHHVDAGGGLHTGGAHVGSIAEDTPPLAAATHVGAWSVVRALGRGGMGEVYLVERAAGDFRQAGALKVLRAGLWTEEMIRRMRRERQILATLEHPNIARLLDGGTTDDGVPYFVMEYVDGEPLLAWVDSRGLEIRARLALYLEVCAAVQSAHQKLVLHRDLKPANVLVTRDGAVKLLDFGIARLFDENADELRTLHAALTPAYASPEQRAGLPVTTASDVYSLGVILHELLKGRRPDAPTAAGEAHLDRDLATILNKSLEEDPARRYATVDALAGDLARYLEGRPIQARRASWGYRATRFLRRNLAASIASAAAIVVLVAGLVVAVTQANVARRERDLAQRRFGEVRELARAIVFPIYDAIENLPGSTEARKLVVESALRYLDRLAGESGGDPSLQRELAMAYRKIGDVQGRAFYGNLGESDKSAESYRRSYELFKAAASAQPESLSNREYVAAGHRMVEIARKTGRHDETMRYAREARVELERLLKRYPDEPLLQRDLNISCDRIADAHLAEGDTAAAMAQRAIAKEVIESLAKAHPDEPRYQRGIVVDCLKSADLLGATGKTAEARALYERATQVAEGRVAKDPNDQEAKRDLSVVYSKHAVFRSWVGDIDTAMAIYGRAQVMAEAMAKADPADASLRFDVYAGEYEMGTILENGNRWTPAAERFQRAYAGFLALADADTSDADARVSVGDAAFRCGRCLGHAAGNAARSTTRSEALGWVRRGRSAYETLDRAGRLSDEQKEFLEQTIRPEETRLAARAGGR